MSKPPPAVPNMPAMLNALMTDYQITRQAIIGSDDFTNHMSNDELKCFLTPIARVLADHEARIKNLENK